MRDPARLLMLEKVERERNSRVLAYLTGDRQGMATRVSFDQLSLIYDHLVEIGHQDRIDLFLYSPGGLTLAGFSIANLVREFCDHFAVLVPFRAQSAATLISLGANEIIMGRLGQLSPVDPTVVTPYNVAAPAPQGRPPQPLPLSVEDVNAYIDLARQEIGLKQEGSMVQVLQSLSTAVHPLALGAVQRSRQQIGMLAKKLMLAHWPKDNVAKVDAIIDILTRKLGSHDYIISRREAKEIGLPVQFPSIELESLMWSLFKQYQRAMDLGTPYSPEAILAGQAEASAMLRRAFVESRTLTHVFETHRQSKRISVMQQGMDVPVPGVQELNLRDEWVEYRDTPPMATAPPSGP